MLKNFKREFNGDYGVKMTLGKLRNFCEIDWPAFGVGWFLEGSLDKVIVNRVFEVVSGCWGSWTPRSISLYRLLAGCHLQLAHMAKSPPRGSM
jgi:hypothetical protein